MRKLIVMLAALALLLSGCTSVPTTIPFEPGEAPVEATPTEAEETTVAQLPDISALLPEAPEGYLPVSDPMEIEAQLALDVQLPNLAEDAEYGLVNGQYAFVTFTFEGIGYGYTVGRGGVPEDKRAYANQVEETWLDAPYTLAWSEDDGSGYAAWQREDVAYRIWAEKGTDADKLRELAILLMPAG